MAGATPHGKLEIDRKRKKELKREPDKFMAATVAAQKE
jgi:hypothetical protein